MFIHSYAANLFVSHKIIFEISVFGREIIDLIYIKLNYFDNKRINKQNNRPYNFIFYFLLCLFICCWKYL